MQLVYTFHFCVCDFNKDGNIVKSENNTYDSMNNDVMISMQVWVKSMRLICCFVTPCEHAL